MTPDDEAINTVSTTAGDDIDRGAREYSADIGDEPVSIALFPAGFVLVDDDGVVTFVDGASGLSGDGRADGIGATDAKIESVNGVATSGDPSYVADIASTSGVVTFTIDSEVPNVDVVPVVFEDVDNDDQLDLDADDAPSEPFGIGGAKLWIPEEASFGLDATGTIQVVRDDVANPFFTLLTSGGDDYTIYYEDSFSFRYGSDQTETLISIDSFETWASGPGADGLGSVPGDTVNVVYNATSSNSEVTIHDDTPMAVGNLTGTAGDPDFNGFNNDAVLDWDAPANPDVVEYDIYRSVQNSDGTFPTPTYYDTETDGTAYNDLSLDADTYLYWVVAINGESGQRSLLDSVVVEIVDEAVEPAPYSTEINVSSADTDGDLDGVDTGDPSGDQLIVFFETASDMEAAADASVDLRGEDGQLVRLTNGSNATFSVGGLSDDELTITLTEAEYTPVEDPNSDGALTESETIEVVASSGITSGGGEWNLPRSGCEATAGCSENNERTTTSNVNLPFGHTNFTLDGVANTLTVMDSGDPIDDGEPFALYDFVTGEQLASGTFDASDTPGTTVSADIAPGQSVLFTYTDATNRQISWSTGALVPNEVPEVTFVSATNSTDEDMIDMTWDEIVTLTGQPDDIEVYDSVNANLVAQGEAISSKTNTVFTVDLNNDLVDGDVYWLRVSSGVAQDSDNNPNPDQAVQFTFQLVNPAPTVDSVNVDGDATTDGGTATTNDTSPVVTGTATDDDGIADVWYSVNGSAYVPATPSDGAFGEATEAFEFTITGPLSEGDHTLDVIALDDEGAFSETWDVTITVSAAAPVVTSVETLPASDAIRVTFSEPVTCSTTAGGLAAWTYDDQSAANDNDGSPSPISAGPSPDECDLTYAGLEVDDFGLLDYNQPADSLDQVQDADGTPLTTVTGLDVVDGVAPTFDSVAAGAAATLTADAIFSEELLASSVEAADFSATVAGSPRAISGVTVSGNTVTITVEPPTLVSGQTVEITYDATASGGVSDLSGNNDAATATNSDTVA